MVGEIQVGAAFVVRDAEVDRALRSIELGARFEQIKNRSDRRRIQGLCGPLIVPTPQPSAKLPAANGPGFAMLVDLKVGVGDARCRMEQGHGGAQHGLVVDHGQGALPSGP
jgi:hypothetical protein